MKISKKLIAVIALAAFTLLSCVSVSFSWYSHNKSAEGTRLKLSQENIPISVKSATNTVSSTTYIANEKGEATTTAATRISVTSAEKIKYYKTTFKNTGSNDVMVDLETTNMPNNADFYIGTLSPTLNEKAYASRAVRTKVSDNTVRVYFKTHSSHNAYWGSYTTAFYPNDAIGSSNRTTNDFNLAYTVGTTETMVRMNRCSGTDSTSDGTGRTDVYYYDVPSNASSFYFFNHWYLCASTDRNWNRTTDITDLSPGKLYYLNGGNVDGQWKAYSVRATDDTLVAVNQHYKSVRMSTGTGVFTDIGLKKSSEDDPDFIPEYYGSSITYSSSNTAVATVNRDGIITPVASGTATITTTITGRYGDTRTIQTTVEIPQNIPQVTVIKNVRVPAGESVEVDWYALNKSASATMTTAAFLLTL